MLRLNTKIKININPEQIATINTAGSKCTNKCRVSIKCRGFEAHVLVNPKGCLLEGLQYAVGEM